jgi:hypothetical protein
LSATGGLLVTGHRLLVIKTSAAITESDLEIKRLNTIENLYLDFMKIIFAMGRGR